MSFANYQLYFFRFIHTVFVVVTDTEDSNVAYVPGMYCFNK